MQPIDLTSRTPAPAPGTAATPAPLTPAAFAAHHAAIARIIARPGPVTHADVTAIYEHIDALPAASRYATAIDMGRRLNASGRAIGLDVQERLSDLEAGLTP